MSFVSLIVKRYMKSANNIFLLSSVVLSTGLIIGIFIFLMSIMRGGHSALFHNIFSIYGHAYITSNVELAKKIQNTKIVQLNYSECFLVNECNGKMNAAISIGVNDIEYRNGLKQYIKCGDINNDKYSIIIGAYLAAKLNVDIGDSLLINIEGGLNLCQVGAIIFTGIEWIDSMTCFTNKQLLEENMVNLKIKNIVFLDNLDALDEYVEECKKQGINVTTWRANLSFLDKIFTQIKVILSLILILFIMNAVLQIFMLLTIIILEKKKDIAILTKLGATHWQIRAIFFIYGIVLIALKIISGFVIGWIFIRFIHSLILNLMNQMSFINPNIIDIIKLLHPKLIFSDLLYILTSSFICMFISLCIGINFLINKDRNE